MIEAINLSKRYSDGALALDALNLSVDPGEIFCILGSNGAGKTTTINLFLNFISPSAGKALVDDIDVQAQPLMAKERVAYVSENVRLYQDFTARTNLEFFARIAGKRNLTDRDYEEAMRLVGLPERAFERKVKTFSKGMQQKLGIAIAVIKDAKALFLDEPTSGLDPKAGAEFSEILLRLREQGKAILMSTHDIFRVRELADRLCVMKEGRKVVERTREELESENLESLYLRYMGEFSSR